MSHDHFYLFKIFQEDLKTTITEEGIAELYGVSLREARSYIHKDLQAKFIDYSYSTFFLTPRGFEFLYCIRNGSLNILC